MSSTSRHRGRFGGALALSAALLLGAVVMLGAAFSAPAATRPPIDSNAEQVLRLAGSSRGPLTLDPALVRDAESRFYVLQLFGSLVRLDGQLAIRNDLAENVDVSSDGLVYTFSLRDRAVFHDGTTIDAAVVAASLNRAADPALADGDGSALPASVDLIDIEGAPERLAGRADTISGIQVINPQTLRITLRYPAADFLFKLSGTSASVVDVRQTDQNNWWRQPNGSGPFTLGGWNGSEISMLGFGNFYGGAPYLKEITVRLGQFAAQPLNLYESGDIDTTNVPVWAVARVEAPSDPLHNELQIVPELSTAYILLSPVHAPFDNVQVREAVVRAFERNKYAEVTMEGRATPAEGIVPPGMYGREWASDVPAFDPDRARQLVEQLGADAETPMTFYGWGAPAILAEILEDELGLNTTAVDLEWHDFLARMDAGLMPAYGLTWIADYPDPSNFMASLFRSDSPSNHIGYKNPEVDALLRTANAELDQDRRAELYLQAQQLVLDDFVLIPVFHSVSYTLTKPYVRGLVVTPIGMLALDEVWIDD